MSRPIYEPSLPRADAVLGYGNRQLFRRPAPRGDDVTSFQAVRAQTPIENIGSTGVFVDWDDWINCNPQVFEPRTTTDAEDPVIGTDLVRRVRLLQPGRYTFSIRLEYSNPASDDIDGVKIALNDDDDPWGFPEEFYSGPLHTYNTTGFVAWTWVALYPMMGNPDPWPDFGGGDFVPAYFTTAAIAVSDCEIELALLEISHETWISCYPESS